MFKLKWSHLEREIKDSELLSDQDEKSLRIQLIDNIIDSVNEYNSHILNYEYEQKQQEIRKRGVVFVPRQDKLLTDAKREQSISSISIRRKPF